MPHPWTAGQSCICGTQNLDASMPGIKQASVCAQPTLPDRASCLDKNLHEQGMRAIMRACIITAWPTNISLSISCHMQTPACLAPSAQ